MSFPHRWEVRYTGEEQCNLCSVVLEADSAGNRGPFSCMCVVCFTLTDESKAETFGGGGNAMKGVSHRKKEEAVVAMRQTDVTTSTSATSIIKTNLPIHVKFQVQKDQIHSRRHVRIQHTHRSCLDEM